MYQAITDDRQSLVIFGALCNTIEDEVLEYEDVPSPSTEVPAADIDRGLRASEARSQDLNRQFFQYSRLWWKEFIEIDPSFKERLVKIFAEDEWGRFLRVFFFFRKKK